MINNLGNFAHPKKRGTITAAKRKGQQAPKQLPGANQKPVYPAATNKFRAADGNMVGSSVVTDANKVSAAPGTNSRPLGTIPPSGAFKTVQKQPPSTVAKTLTHQRASKPAKPAKSGKEKRSTKLPFFGGGY